MAEADCGAVDGLTLDFNLANDWWAGTDDTLDIIFGPSYRATTIEHSPWRGETKRKDIDLKYAFGANKVRLRDINLISVLQEPEPHPITGDYWELQGLFLEANCTLSGRTIRVDKYDMVKKWLGTERSYPSVVWTGSFQPRDWNPE
ncbi:hypothetical protein CDD83_679 [Cordyceps sp. RAO-2017]|nr:hypothetical protein CDD83_679 [Cordyceps sp. RAO-2017]